MTRRERQPVPPGTPVDLEADPGRVVRIVLLGGLLIEGALAVLDWTVSFAGVVDAAPIRRLFNITREDGLASWFASTQTLVLALTTWLTWAVVRRQGRHASGWLVLAVVFTTMAVDDGAKMHERLGTVLRGMSGHGFGATLVGAFPSYSWQPLLVPLFAVFGLFTLVFLHRQLGQRWARAAVLGALILLSAAVGLDFIEGLDRGHDWNLYAWLSHSAALDDFTHRRFDTAAFATVRRAGMCLEEVWEMAGITLLWAAIVSHLTTATPALRIRFERRTSRHAG